MEASRRQANPEHVEILVRGVSTWNEWRKANPSISPHITSLNHPFHSKFPLKNLRGIDFSHCDLAGGHFDGVDFREADFQGADLTAARFRNCDFSEANLSEVFIAAYFEPTSFEITTYTLFKEVSLRGANLSGIKWYSVIFEDVDVREANLLRAQLFGCKLSRTGFAGTQFGWSVFVDTDLSSALNLDQASHRGPSSLGLDSVYRSRGEIPASFLRGCGVPDTFVDYLDSLAAEAIQYHTCFISYSSHDDRFAHRLRDDLQGHGVRCWFAPEDMKIGARIRRTIDESIHLHDRLLLILSKDSIASQWVEKEVETAFEEERQRGEPVLFPVRIDAAVMTTPEAWAADIRRTRQIGDFSNWQDEVAYRRVLDRLLNDLK